MLAACAGPAGAPVELAPLVADLEARVPGILAAHRVPGASIVLIEDREIAWSGAFGVRRAGSPERVTERTVFEACSLSKPVFAYAALGLVELGELDLDAPLDSYLVAPYHPEEPAAGAITARMVLAHRTGFPNWRRGEPLRLSQEPGAGFTYSGEGFLYLQVVVERITGAPLDRWIDGAVLLPLGMSRSSYVWRDDLADDFAAGHDRGGAVLADRSMFERPNAAFTLYTTARDYARFLVAHLSPKTGPRSTATIDAMLSLQHPPDPEQGERGRRTLGWARAAPARGGWVEHSGANGTGFRCYARFQPERGDGLVIMTNGLEGRAVWSAVVEVVDAFARFRGCRGFR